MSVQASRTFYVRKTASDITFSVSARERILHLRLEDRRGCVKVRLKNCILVLVKKIQHVIGETVSTQMRDLDS
jgi:hypothetical protein